MDEAFLESEWAAFLDGALDEAGGRRLLERLRAAPPEALEAAARDALADRWLRQAARDPLDADAVLRALPARSGSRLESRVMSRVRSVPFRPRVRVRRAGLWGWGAAAAVLAAAAGAAWRIARPAALPYTLQVDGLPVARGETIFAPDGPVRLDLGNYCRLRLEPMSVLRIEGRRAAEEVCLERGRVACEIEPGRGTFAVRTEVGTVAVQGTAFEAALEDADPSRPGTLRRLVVAVEAGAVRLAGPGGERLVRAGETAAVVPQPPAGEYGPDAEGFIHHWLLLGPVPLDPWIREHVEKVEGPIFDAPLFPGQMTARPRPGGRAAVGGRRHVWRPHAASGAAVDLEAFARTFGAEKDNAIVCGVAYLVCRRDLPGVRLAIGSDDSSTWRLNDREIVRVYTNHAVDRDQNVSAPVTLAKGTNVLAFSVINGDGPTGICARFLDAGGGPVRDFTVTLAPPPGGE